MISIGFHTDAFNTSNWNFEQCLKWAQQHEMRFIECAAIDGVYMLHSLGYWPHIALYEDPVLLRRKMDSYGVQLSQIDAAFPLSIPEGLTLGVEYVLHTIRWAKMAGCPRIDTTDDKEKPAGATDKEILAHLKRVYGLILPIAEAHGIIINVEPHGYSTTKPELMAEILGLYDSPCFGMNMDTGNAFIAGRDPVAYLEQFIKKVNHIHIKDVSAELAAAMKGELTGIALSTAAIGEGVNAGNIRKCVELLVGNGFQGTMSLECDAQGGPMLERSLNWTRRVLEETMAGAAATA
ncbi:MAG: sugar phosphate isomerase/epimerase family protein [Bryobacteraceae bacterium]